MFVEQLHPDDPTATPVLFLHGWGGSGIGTWVASRLPARLRDRGHTCIVADLPGHGCAERVNGASHRSEDYDEIVEKVDEGLPVGGRCDVVGFSLGAKIALMLAARRPERYRRIVAAGVGSNIFSSEPAGPALRAILSGGIGPDVPARQRRSAVYALQSGGDPEAMGACIARSWTPPTRADLEGLPSEVLLAAGDEDEVVGSVEELAACLPTATVRRLRGIDHLSTPYSTELHDLVAEFLSCEEAEGSHG